MSSVLNMRYERQQTDVVVGGIRDAQAGQAVSFEHDGVFVVPGQSVRSAAGWRKLVLSAARAACPFIEEKPYPDKALLNKNIL